MGLWLLSLGNSSGVMLVNWFYFEWNGGNWGNYRVGDCLWLFGG